MLSQLSWLSPPMQRWTLAAVLGYLLGSLPSARIAARLAHRAVDLTTTGTGNPGAFNAAQQLGGRWGVLVAAVDIGKGSLAAWLGRVVAGDAGCYLAATTSVAGHVYPPAGRGGRGAATSFGSCLVVFPIYAPVDIAVGAGALVARRQAAPGSRAAPAVLASTAAFLAAAGLWSWRRWPNPGGPKSGPGLFGYAAATSVLMLAKWLPR